MIRPATCVCMLLAAGSGLYLYQAKHQGQMLDREIAKVERTTEAARARMGVLRAEGALLNDPQRLQELAAAHLPNLAVLQPGQFTTIADLDRRLPPVGAPPAPPAPLEPTAPVVALLAPVVPAAAPAAALVASVATVAAAAAPGADPRSPVSAAGPSRQPAQPGAQRVVATGATPAARQPRVRVAAASRPALTPSALAAARRQAPADPYAIQAAATAAVSGPAVSLARTAVAVPAASARVASGPVSSGPVASALGMARVPSSAPAASSALYFPAVAPGSFPR